MLPNVKLGEYTLRSVQPLKCEPLACGLRIVGQLIVTANVKLTGAALLDEDDEFVNKTFAQTEVLHGDKWFC